MKLIDEMSKGKRILNIDETHLTTLDFRTKKWCKKSKNNSIPS